MNELDETFWDKIFRARNARWSGEPNDRIVDAVAGVEPGFALESDAATVRTQFGSHRVGGA